MGERRNEKMNLLKLQEILGDEIKAVLGKSVDMKVLDDMIKEVDTNGDGEISLVEFKEMMLKFLE